MSGLTETIFSFRNKLAFCYYSLKCLDTIIVVYILKYYILFLDVLQNGVWIRMADDTQIAGNMT